MIKDDKQPRPVQSENETNIGIAIKKRVAIRDIGAEGRQITITLDDAERRTLEELLDIEDLTSFTAVADLRPLRKDRFAMEARIKANFSQISAISLKGVEKQMDEKFDTEFWPIAQADPEVSPELDIDYADEMVEFYENNWLEVGQVIYEQFVIALDLFPRAEGEVFDWEGPSNKDDVAPDNPFAVLKKLQ
jgi:uncharacterized metal-binding protein YceD (DUF177 family)